MILEGLHSGIHAIVEVLIEPIIGIVIICYICGDSQLWKLRRNKNKH